MRCAHCFLCCAGYKTMRGRGPLYQYQKSVRSKMTTLLLLLTLFTTKQLAVAKDAHITSEGDNYYPDHVFLPTPNVQETQNRVRAVKAILDQRSYLPFQIWI